MEIVLATCVGLGLATASGLRVFVPLLMVALATKLGWLPAAPGLAWMGTWPAIAGFSIAALLETVGFYVPWLDHALDAIATPAAAIAGTILAGTQLVPQFEQGGVSPLIGWATSLVAGGGLASVVQVATVGTRAASTATTGGLGNPIVATIENGLAAALSVVSVFVPILAGVVLVSLMVVVVVWWSRRGRRRGVVAPVLVA